MRRRLLFLILAPLMIAVALVLLVLVEPSLLQPVVQPMRAQLLRIATKIISHQLNGSLEVGRIDGSLLSAPTLHEVILRDHQGTVMGRIATARLRYDLFALLRKRMHVRQAEFVRPQLTLMHTSDGRLTLHPIFVTSPRKRKAKTPFPFIVQVEAARIIDGEFQLGFPFLQGVHTATDVQANVSGEVRHKYVHIEVQSLTTLSTPANVAIRTLQGAMTISGHDIRFQKASLRTDTTQIDLDGQLPGGTDLTNLSARLQPLNVAEIGRLTGRPELHGQLNAQLRMVGPPEDISIAGALRPATGSITLRGQLRTDGPLPSYTVQLDVGHLDLGTLVERDAWQSDINLRLHLTGQGLPLRGGHGDIRLDLQPSHLGAIRVQPSRIHVDAKPQGFKIRHFEVNSSVLTTTMHGMFDLAQASDLGYRIQSQLPGLQGLLAIDALDGTLDAQGRMTGIWPRLTASGTFKAQNLRYQETRAQALQATFEASQRAGKPQAEARVQLYHAKAGALGVDALTVNATYDGHARRVDFTTQARRKAVFDGTLGGTLTFGSTKHHIRLHQFSVQLGNRTWRPTTTLEATVGPDILLLKPMHFAHGEESLTLSGGIEGPDLRDLQLQAQGIDITFLRRLFDLPEAIGGRATLQAYLHGSRDAPQFRSELTVEAEAEPQVPFDRLHLTLGYVREQLHTAVRLRQDSRDVFRLDGRLPIRLRLTPLPLEQRLRNTPLTASVLFNRPVLHAFQASFFPRFPLIPGELKGTFDLTGTLTKLNINTNLRLHHFGIRDVLTELQASLQLTASVLPAPSLSALSHALTTGHWRPMIPRLTLRVPSLQGMWVKADDPSASLTISDLQLQADGSWNRTGVQATLHTLQANVQAFALAQARLVLQGRLSPKHIALTRLHIQTPQSVIDGQGHMTLPDQRLNVQLTVPRFTVQDALPTFAPSWPQDVQGTVTVEGHLSAPQLIADIAYAGARLSVNASARLDDASPSYTGTLDLDAFTLTPFVPTLPGTLRARLEFDGRGGSATQRHGRLDLHLDSTDFALAPGLSAEIQAVLQGSAIQLTALNIRSALATFTASGTLSAAQDVDATYTVTLGDLTPLRVHLNLPIDAEGGSSGSLTGPLRALRLHTTLQFDTWRYGATQGERLEAEATVTNMLFAPLAQLHLSLDNLQGPGIAPTSLRMSSTYRAQKSTMQLLATDGPYAGSGITADIVLGDTARLTLQQVRLQQRDWRWRNPQPLTLEKHADGRVRLLPGSLRNNQQQLRFHGTVTPEGTIDAALHIRQVHIGPLIRLFAPHVTSLDGQMELTVDVQGTTRQPQARAVLHLHDLHVNGEALGGVEGRFRLTKTGLYTDLRWIDRAHELFSVRGSMGLHPQGRLAMRLQMPGTDLGRIALLSPAVIRSGGQLYLDVKLDGPVHSPMAYGSLEIHRGILKLAATGALYEDIHSRLVFAGNQVQINPLQAHSDKGTAKLTGWFTHSAYTLQQLHLDLKARKFTAMHTPTIDATVSGRLGVQGTLQAMYAKGDLTVNRARIRIDNMLNNGPGTVAPWELTVAGVYGPGHAMLTTTDGSLATTLHRVPLPFLQATISVDLPKNVWVQGSGTAVELRGRLLVHKPLQKSFAVGGDINTVQGFVTFFGKKFVLQRGKVTFTDTETIDPFLDITSTHTVSDYLVTIQVEGKSTQPQLVLSSTPDLIEQDILSVLAFGKTIDRLTSSEQTSLSTRAEKVAGSVAAGLLEKSIGRALGFDTIEIATGEELGTGRVSVGRYVTQDIFLSYERHLNDHGGNTIGLELSLSRHLKLKGSGSDVGESALDLIWRLDY